MHCICIRKILHIPFFLSSIELWGLDEEGRFITDGSNLIKEDFLRKLISFMSSKKYIDVKELILQDLKNVKKSIDTEAAINQHSNHLLFG